MARIAERLPENVPGAFYVDGSCIDCDLCRQIAPSTFEQVTAREQSYVARQPGTPAEEHRALMALVACPTASIGTAPRRSAQAAAAAFPEPVPDLVDEQVYFCGFAAESSFGASSYLIRRPAGNALVDSPRAARRLMSRIEELGGVKVMFLTHRDDVADHAAYHRRFGCERILHRDDVSRGTAAIELPLSGREPIRLAPDLVAIPVPGHTAGSMALLFADTYLFTGDHLWWSERVQGLHASRAVCWHSWDEQVRSIERLLDFDFEWVLPGHGRRWRAPSRAAMRAELERLLGRTRDGAPSNL